jgi:REP element-mobilizing transposase RayT
MLQVMTRPLRLEFPNALYHVTSRGDRRENIFEDDDDRSRFLEILEGVVADDNWLCHGYCLMDNHYHLIIETLDGNLSKGMRQLNGVYTQASNRRYGRSGHLSPGRYKAILVDKDRYLLELSRYVVLNPLRAKGMVKRLEDWSWSSYLPMVGDAPKPEWLITDWLLSLFGKLRKIAMEKYRQFVIEAV